MLEPPPCAPEGPHGSATVISMSRVAGRDRGRRTQTLGWGRSAGLPSSIERACSMPDMARAGGLTGWFRWRRRTLRPAALALVAPALLVRGMRGRSASRPASHRPTSGGMSSSCVLRAPHRRGSRRFAGAPEDVLQEMIPNVKERCEHRVSRFADIAADAHGDHGARLAPTHSTKSIRFARSTWETFFPITPSPCVRGCPPTRLVMVESSLSVIRIRGSVGNDAARLTSRAPRGIGRRAPGPSSL